MEDKDLQPVKEEAKSEVVTQPAPQPTKPVAPVIQHPQDKFECKDGVLYKNGEASGYC
jgi:hypothetical protein